MAIDQNFLDSLASGSNLTDSSSEPTATDKPKPVNEPASSDSSTTSSGDKQIDQDSAAVTEEKTDNQGLSPYELLDSLFAEESKKPSDSDKLDTDKSNKPEPVVQPKQELAATKSLLDELSSILPSDDDGYDKIISNRDGFVEFYKRLFTALDSYYRSAFDDRDKRFSQLKSEAVEDSIKAASGIVSERVRTELSLQRLVDKFYEDNPRLLPIRNVVGRIANKIAQEHPDWDYPKVFEETAKQSNLFMSSLSAVSSEGNKNGTDSPKRSPGFVDVRSKSRKPPADRTQLQKDIDMLIS
jgi:hypothetical protein